ACGCGGVVSSWSLLFAAILAAIRHKIHLSRCPDSPSHLSLVRWDHPKRGQLSPATFISLAEERGLIDELGLWVLHQACTYAASASLPWVAVNASPIQFRDEKFADRVFEILEATGLQARRLEIEITEGLLLQNSQLTQSTLMRLRAR
ncbi:MAG: EAL domain-containing protein, partial [Cypionkella sp.]